MIHLVTLLQVVRLLIKDIFYILWYFKVRRSGKYVKQTNGIVRKHMKFDGYNLKVSSNRYKAAFTHRCEASTSLGRECKSCRI